MRTHKGVFYFDSYTAARDYASAHNLPAERIIYYTRGWAIQRYVSGPYAGPEA